MAIRMEGAGDQAQPEPVDLVAYCCENSAGPAMSALRRAGKLDHVKMRVITMPCAGNLNLVNIINDFVNGAQGVLVAACRHKNCMHANGDRTALRRVERARQILKDLNLDPDRIAFLNTASNMPDEVDQAVRELYGRVHR